jgi:hypothetical protein
MTRHEFSLRDQQNLSHKFNITLLLCLVKVSDFLLANRFAPEVDSRILEIEKNG